MWEPRFVSRAIAVMAPSKIDLPVWVRGVNEIAPKDTPLLARIDLIAPNV